METTRRTFIKTAGAAGIGAAVAGAALSAPLPAEAAEASAQQDEPTFTPGTYEATSQGRNGSVTVSVTFSEHAIESVEVLDNMETADISYIALNVLPQVIVEAQSPDVDSVAGATLSSFAVKNAVADAIRQAGADPDALTSRLDPASVEQNMTPGTYHATAWGKWKKGTVEGIRHGAPDPIEATEVDVTVSETGIESVNVTTCSDTPSYYEVAVERMTADVVDQQSIIVDTVTGCTMTAAAVTSAVAKALQEAGADMGGFWKRTPKKSGEEAYDCDVCVVGAGTAGSCAAARALDLGLSVVVLEKCARYAGMGSAYAGSLILGSELNKEAGDETTPDEVFHNIMDYAYWTINASLLYNILSNCGRWCDWFNGKMHDAGFEGFTIERNSNYYEHTTGDARGIEKWNVLYDNYILPGDCQLLLNTPAESLIVEDGQVKGVKATKQDGTSVTVNAKAVIVATGGFGGNKAMQEELLGSSHFECAGNHSNTGDGIRMCMDAGCGLSLAVSPHHAEFCGNDVMDYYGGYLKFINQTGFLMLDPQGARFMDESYCITYPLARGASALRRVTSAYAVFTEADLQKLYEHGPSALMGEDLVKELGMRGRAAVDGYPALMDELDECFAKGQAFKADTLEELGELCGFDKDIYTQNIDEYLEAVETGADVKFGKRAELLYPLAEGPFYAVRMVSPVFGTFNGIKVDEKLRALGKNQQVDIAGLFVASLDAGGNFSYPYTDYVGSTSCFALTSGMLAAEYAGEYLGAAEK